MLLPELPLQPLLDELASLPAADRRAILARLTPQERSRILVCLRGAPAARSGSPYSPDIAARIDGVGNDMPHSAMTPVARMALARIASTLAEERERSNPPALADAVLWWFAGRGGRR